VDLRESREENIVQEREEIEDHALVLTEPVPQEKVVLPHQKEDGQSLVQTIVMIIGAIILIILLVLFARWVYHKVNSDQSDTAGTSQLPPESSSPSSQSGVSTQPSTSSTPSAGSTAPTTNQNGQIANTGPGNVVAIFAGSTLAAAGLHYIISLRKFNKRGY
jgi:cytoskeletal protein RodZ